MSIAIMKNSGPELVNGAVGCSWKMWPFRKRLRWGSTVFLRVSLKFEWSFESFLDLFRYGGYAATACLDIQVWPWAPDHALVPKDNTESPKMPKFKDQW